MEGFEPLPSNSDEGIGEDEHLEKQTINTLSEKKTRKRCNHQVTQEDYLSNSSHNGTDDEQSHLQGDFLKSMLFPHLRNKDHWLFCPFKFKRQSGGESSNSSGLIKEMFCPARSPLNVKLFGGKTAIELEINRCKSSGYIIHPFSAFRQYWDLIIMAVMIVNIFVVPVDIAFSPADREFAIVHTISDGLCIIDIILNFRTGYRTSAELNTFELGQKQVALHYLKTWFALDVLSSFPFHYIILIFAGKEENFSLGIKGASRALKFLKIAKLLNLLKLLRLTRIIRGISRYEEVYCVTTVFMRYIKLLSMMLLVAHWNGCFHFLIPMLQDFPSACWVRRCQLVDEHWFVQYCWALFKTLSHMLCIGYGRFIPALLSEAVATIFTMVTGATFYALFVAHSMAFIIQSDSSKNRYQEKFKQIDEYMSYRRLPEDTKKRVRDYFDRKYHSGRFFDEHKIFGEISPLLKDEILNHTCHELVENIAFLRDSPDSFVTAILNKLSYEVFLSGEYIVSEGSICKELYFIRKGNTEMTIGGFYLENLGKGSYFGEIGTFTNQRSLYSVKAFTTCDVFILKKHDLDAILIEHTNMNAAIEHAALIRLIFICNECFLLDENQDNEDKDNIIPPTIITYIRNALKSFLHQEENEQGGCFPKSIVDILQDVIKQHRGKHESCNICENCFIEVKDK